jgi:outer membrane protein
MTPSARVVVPLSLAAAIAFIPQGARALDAGDWLVRVRGIAVEPNDSSGPVNPDLPTARIGVDSDFTGEVDFTYMFTENIGAELILATTQHDLEGEGAISALGTIGDARLLPPVLTLQYHFLPKNWIRPYVGVGVNYTIFYDESASSSLSTALGGPTSVSLDNSVGVAGQAGVDVDVAENVFLNLDVKYVDLDTTANITTGSTVRTSDVEIDPVIIGVGVGIRF